MTKDEFIADIDFCYIANAGKKKFAVVSPVQGLGRITYSCYTLDKYEGRMGYAYYFSGSDARDKAMNFARRQLRVTEDFEQVPYEPARDLARTFVAKHKKES